jgi:hypothetical protein
MGETIHSRIISQATDFQPCQLGRAVEDDPAKVTHDAMEPACQVFDGSADVAPLGGDAVVVVYAAANLRPLEAVNDMVSILSAG